MLRLPLLCDFCGQHCRKTSDVGTGYGIDGTTNARICYACCATRDKAYMLAHGRITLYLTSTPNRDADRVTNWPGSLSFRVAFWIKGRHNIARDVITAYFIGPDGCGWSARCVGPRYNQLATCRRLSRATVARLNWFTRESLNNAYGS